VDPRGRLDDIAARVRVCVRCRLHEGRTHAVPGEGPVDVRVVLVGEAPGRTEDAMGRPFVGSAGRVLDAALRSAGLDRQAVFITNLVKCRPPGNRRPRKDEIGSCLPYLMGQLDAVRPRLIVTLGETSFRALVPDRGPFADVRRKRFAFRGTPLIPTYHPAAVLYNRRLEADLREDLREAAEWTRTKAGPRVPIAPKTITRSAVSSGAAIVDRRGRVFLLHIARGRWCLPKGGIEAGETLERAAIRETREETGLHVRLDGRLTTIRYSFRVPSDRSTVRKRVTYFLAKPIGGKVRLEPGFDRYLWATKPQALRLVRYANDREVLRWAFRRIEASHAKKRTPSRAPGAKH
jgi:uracil-DNA glycosylase